MLSSRHYDFSILVKPPLLNETMMVWSQILNWAMMSRPSFRPTGTLLDITIEEKEDRTAPFPMREAF